MEKSHSNWKKLATTELEQAENARHKGNEGQARVCARRAAGHVAGEYLQRQGIPFRSDNALEKLRFLAEHPELTSKEVDIIQHFLMHITPEHKLPIDAGLIADVRLLAQQLLNESLD
jgi:hypothetical protein